MANVDSLGDRMKHYEQMYSGNRLMPLVPAMARLDGVAFHTFTRGLKRPYDERLSNIMLETTRYLVQLTNARVGYTQSDEISLIWQADDFNEQIYFDAKIFKMLSVLASRASVFFNQRLKDIIPEKANENPVFDCRVWNVPNKEEAANTILWRERDATRNSVSMAAQSLYSHAELQNKSTANMHDMLFAKGINWNDYPPFFKRGSYIQRRKVERPFTAEELLVLPEKHAARTNPKLVIQRTEWSSIEVPPLGNVTNRVEVLFHGATPLVEISENIHN